MTLSSINPAALNVATLKELLGSPDAGVMRAYLELFKTTVMRDLVPRLALAATAGDTAAMVYLAHSLKGLAAHAGADRLRLASEALERLVRASADLTAIHPTVTEITAAADETTAAIDRWLAEA